MRIDMRYHGHMDIYEDGNHHMHHATPAGSAPAPEYGELQQLVNELFAVNPSGYVSKMDAVMRAEVDDLNDDLREVIDLLPGGRYKRGRLCDQINSIVTAHGWAYVYGTVE